ncbi:MAG: hypothetical protein COU06_01825 [Candidatus Harrisonbacteria bacterium CG10_big_fil_rev_8_21_14_0_10_38_8]|uniref:Succinylglutamate desuccinylase/Aspartoacylase catalytic domain-containing protein n=1 Tax=Candidatus Harrisonbacteria bacterium CG10_big_fil_rev_8_21_14_0_10_38_8 TaxID=1974582 RepID=A0A2M6WK23_9BACT|nr:MAG: hypothetical protein COU06_01825 [Candidatus Harrisonbacteria bacterium CG10_big_fil_rev_8_21_14_0_10_38_8]
MRSIDIIDYEKIHRIKGVKPGKKVVIIGGVHGNEVCGVRLLSKFIEEDIKIKSGELILIFGNPRAINEGVRFIDTNLNRLFQSENKLSKKEKESYEFERMKTIRTVLEEADILIDIHSSNSIVSKPFIICENNSYNLVENIPFEIISSGWDEMQPGGTDYFMNSINKQGVCIECGSNTDPKTLENATKAVSQFLIGLGIIEGNLIDNLAEKKYLKVFFQYKTKTNFIPAQEFSDFQFIKENTLIGYDDKELITNQESGYILFSRERINPNEEGFLMAKEINS